MKFFLSKSLAATLTVFAFLATGAGAQTASPAPLDTMAPAATATPAPTSTPTPPKSNNGRHLGQIKKLKTATLPASQIAYAMTHQLQEAKQLAKMRRVNFDNIRIVKLSSLMKLRYRVETGETVVAMDGPFVVADAQMQTVAQATSAPLPSTNGSNSPIQYLHNVLANINVSNALNNLLNNSTVNIGVSLSDVLNNNKIAIGQVVGIYIGGGGLINTIVK